MGTIYTLSQPCVAGTTYQFPAFVGSQADTDIFKTTVSLIAGDVQVSKDGGGYSNITSLPSEIAATGELTVILSSAETTGATKYITVKFTDAAGDEWQDVAYIVPMSTAITDVATSTALATVDGNVDTLVADDVPGLIAALNNLSAAQVWAYATRTLSSFGALVASIWSYATRTLTMSGDAIVAVVKGSAITVQTRTRWIIPITGAGSLAGRSKLYFTVKSKHTNTDAQALCQVEETAKLLVFGGTAPISADNGTLVVDDVAAGDFTVTIEVAETARANMGAYYWDLKSIGSTPDPRIVVDGVFTVEDVITRATT